MSLPTPQWRFHSTPWIYLCVSFLGKPREADFPTFDKLACAGKFLRVASLFLDFLRPLCGCAVWLTWETSQPGNKIKCRYTYKTRVPFHKFLISGNIGIQQETAEVINSSDHLLLLLLCSSLRLDFGIDINCVSIWTKIFCVCAKSPNTFFFLILQSVILQQNLKVPVELNILQCNYIYLE